jgi:Arc/MetJ family transcription regulator
MAREPEQSRRRISIPSDIGLTTWWREPYNASDNTVKEVSRMVRMVKKTIELDQDYIDRARLIFEVRTEKEAVNKALEMAVIDDDIIRAHRLVGGKGEVIDEVFK